MALYAFDGTCNEDEKKDENETNVRKFLLAYEGANFEENYLAGVGTRFGLLGTMLGGVFGAGGKTRIEEMYDKLIQKWKAGDRQIDIIGFSRGAALAVHFANLISQHGVQYDDVNDNPEIRFLGVWDIVGSFGIPINFVFNFHDINIGYDITSVSRKVKHCFHAMAMHKRRQTFEVTRLNSGNQHGNVQEMWFRGVHSDVGGGNGNTKLSNISLAWMLQKGADCGLPIKREMIQVHAKNSDATVPLFKNFDPIKNDMRPVFPSDTIHDSAAGTVISLGEDRTFVVGSAEKYSWSGVFLEAGAFYTFAIDDDQMWEDGDMKCSPAGWKSEELPWYKESVVELFENKRRCPSADWFELIGSVGDEGGELFRIGRGGAHATYRARKSGPLFAFANDVKAMYFNNHGQIKVKVKRVQGPGAVELSFFDGPDSHAE